METSLCYGLGNPSKNVLFDMREEKITITIILSYFLRDYTHLEMAI